MDQDVDCRVCGSAATDFLCFTPATNAAAAARLSTRRCRDCGSVFIGTPVTAGMLADAYGWNQENYYRAIEDTNDRKMSAALRELAGLLDPDAALLDLGTGNGRFVELARNAGFTNVSAHEIPGADLSRIEALAAGLYLDYDYASIPDRSFDCVVLLDVAEHVPDVSHLFRTCRRILREGGILYLHTPVVTRVDRLMHRVQRLPGVGAVGRMWQGGRTSIFHLQNYTRRSLELALARSGFSDVRIRVVNELSWPVAYYIRVHLLQRHGLPPSLAPLLALPFYPLLATRTFNANKAVVTAR
ncbi:MAG TPA: class I SAM-dependent methyltransferase [Longimicrobium sp.]|nr:class I SAM-dependent methyltransferase [Longimicrobium sp.]